MSGSVPDRQPIRLTLYSRPGCHLCDEMKVVVARVMRSSHLPLTLDEVDISGSAALESQYGWEIPVLLIEGRKAAKYRLTDDELVRILEARASGTSLSTDP